MAHYCLIKLNGNDDDDDLAVCLDEMEFLSK